MPSQRQIERFTLAFHRAAMERLRCDPTLRGRALEVIDLWEAQGLSCNGQVYRDRWRGLLNQDVAQIEQAVCVDTDDAATMRSMSPLGFVLDTEARKRLREQAMAV